MKITRLTCTLLLGCLCLAACSSNPEHEGGERAGAGNRPELSEKALRLEADSLYRHARTLLDRGDYSTAITDYDKLINRYPFTDYGTQAELEKIFALYKSYKYDEAASAADRFLRDHPRHPKADYVQYLKGLIDSDRDQSLLDALPIDTSKRDVSSQRLAFSDFQILAVKYPNSRYLGDARKRMIALRDQVARHELSIVQFYVKRGAYIAAAKRAEEIMADFPGAPATGQALQLLETSYRQAGLNDDAQRIAKLIAANPGVLKPVRGKPLPRSGEVAAEDRAAAAEAPPAALPPAEQKKHKGGFFPWFTGLFSRFDTTKPENTYEIVIPTHHEATDAAATGGPNAGNTGGTTPSTSGAAKPADAATTPSSDQAATKTATPEPHHFSVTVGPSPEDEWHPADEKPKAANGSTAAAPTTGGTGAAVPPSPANPPGAAVQPQLKTSDTLGSEPATTGTAATPESTDATPAPAAASVASPKQ
jgi:outer membrane protein assembly factor BamD